MLSRSACCGEGWPQATTGHPLMSSEQLEGAQCRPCATSNSSPSVLPSLLPPTLWAPLLSGSRAGNELCRPKTGTSVSINPPPACFLGVITGSEGAWGKERSSAQVGPGEGRTSARRRGGTFQNEELRKPPLVRDGEVASERRAGWSAEQVVLCWACLCAPWSSSLPREPRPRGGAPRTLPWRPALGSDRAVVQAVPGAVCLVLAVEVHVYCAFSGKGF